MEARRRRPPERSLLGKRSEEAERSGMPEQPFRCFLYKKTPDGKFTLHNPTKYLLGYLESQGLIMQPDILVKEEFKSADENIDQATNEYKVDPTNIDAAKETIPSSAPTNGVTTNQTVVSTKTPNVATPKPQSQVQVSVPNQNNQTPIMNNQPQNIAPKSINPQAINPTNQVNQNYNVVNPNQVNTYQYGSVPNQQQMINNIPNQIINNPNQINNLPNN